MVAQKQLQPMDYHCLLITLSIRAGWDIHVHLGKHSGQGICWNIWTRLNFTYHDWKNDGYLSNHLEDAQQHEKDDLVSSIRVDPAIGNVAEKLVVWFVLVRHEQDRQSLHKLKGREREN